MIMNEITNRAEGIFEGALCESMRVQLFSSPQQQQARIARSEYRKKHILLAFRDEGPASGTDV